MIISDLEGYKLHVECLMSVEEADTIVHNSKKLSLSGLLLIYKTIRKAGLKNQSDKEYVTAFLSRRYLQSTAKQLAEAGRQPVHTAPEHSPHVIEVGDFRANEATACRNISNQIHSFLVHSDEPPSKSIDTVRQ